MDEARGPQKSAETSASDAGKMEQDEDHRETMLAASNVVTIGRRKCTLDVPSMMKNTSEMDAR